MVAPLTAHDTEILRWRRLVQRIAWILARQFHAAWVEDIEAACWYGVEKGLASYRPDCGRRLLTHVWHNVWWAGIDFAKRAERRGIRFARTGEVPRTYSLVELTRQTGLDTFDWIAPTPPEEWGESDWRHFLDRLAPRPARAVELRYRYGLTNAEVAQAMGYASGKSAATVVQAGIRRLRRLVQRGLLEV